ncbi:hypothetical protein [Aliikangiella coralliicola]|uniref:Uncharacterized protein n=1 Tax=Aliikangiella coralliicola TaxID=2592383 RepID=A0A545UIV9_9GAMM|nr:hypothetical protein [Aliikangiella coralliicola]TQV89405.1 hypothetical protein FLL46_00550 [Aliikangiella coralliicola]
MATTRNASDAHQAIAIEFRSPDTQFSGACAIHGTHQINVNLIPEIVPAIPRVEGRSPKRTKLETQRSSPGAQHTSPAPLAASRRPNLPSTVLTQRRRRQVHSHQHNHPRLQHELASSSSSSSSSSTSNVVRKRQRNRRRIVLQSAKGLDIIIGTLIEIFHSERLNQNMSIIRTILDYLHFIGPVDYVRIAEGRTNSPFHNWLRSGLSSQVSPHFGSLQKDRNRSNFYRYPLKVEEVNLGLLTLARNAFDSIKARLPALPKNRRLLQQGSLQAKQRRIKVTSWSKNTYVKDSHGNLVPFTSVNCGAEAVTYTNRSFNAVNFNAPGHESAIQSINGKGEPLPLCEGHQHAEMRLVDFAIRIGARLKFIAVDKPFCIFCAAQLYALGYEGALSINTSYRFGNLQSYTFSPYVLKYRFVRERFWGRHIDEQFMKLSVEDKIIFLQLLADQADGTKSYLCQQRLRRNRAIDSTNLGPSTSSSSSADYST